MFKTEITAMEKEWELETPVLCIIFARPEQFAICFQRVREVRPKILLVWQDGPRANVADDIKNIEKTRKISEEIDWNCTVYRNYHDTNMGCDPSTFYAHQWAFSIVDKCIVLEDDILASKSFFFFCQDLLKKYENDKRVDRICGQTLYGGVPNKDYSYFFSRSGSSWGWASWRRVAEEWEPDYRFLDNEYFINLGRHRFNNKRYEKSLNIAKKRKEEGIPYWEHIIGFNTTLNSGLVIYPSVNMVENIGLSKNSTHAPDNLAELPKDIRVLFETTSQEIQFPLKHPPYIIEDYHYFETVMKRLNPNIFIRIRRIIIHQLRKKLLKLNIIKI